MAEVETQTARERRTPNIANIWGHESMLSEQGAAIEASTDVRRGQATKLKYLLNVVGGRVVDGARDKCNTRSSTRQDDLEKFCI